MNETIFLAMARGIFMGLGDTGDMDALFPEVKGDWRSAVNDEEKVRKLARILKENQSSQPVPNEPASGEKYFPKGLKFGDWLFSPADKSVPWRQEPRTALFVEYYGREENPTMVRAILAKGSKDITILFSYDEWEVQ